MNYEEMTNSVAVHVQFRHMPQSDSIKQLVQLQAARLERFASFGAHCDVVVDETQHGDEGCVYRVSARFKTPCEKLYAATILEENTTHDFLYSSVQMAFDEIETQLQKKRKRNTRRKGIDLAA